MMRSKLGPTLFGIYLLLYGGFVLLAAFSPDAMDLPIAGVNLAVWYGFALIVSAIVLAVLYGMFAPSDPGDASTAAAAAATTSADETAAEGQS